MPNIEATTTGQPRRNSLNPMVFCVLSFIAFLLSLERVASIAK